MERGLPRRNRTREQIRTTQREASAGAIAKNPTSSRTPVRGSRMDSTKDVVDNHLKCFGEGNLKGILSDFASDAILFTPDGPLRGADAIRPFFQALIAEFGKPGAAFSLQRQ